MHVPFAPSAPDAVPAGRRALLALSKRVLEAAEGAVTDALLELGRGPEDAQRAARTTDRLRYVVGRDRDAVRAKPTAGVPESSAPAPVIEALDAPAPLASTTMRAPRSKCDEPIRTRTYAKLLAAQGEPQRALSIYVHLMEERAFDATLAAEAAELRRLLELESAFGA